MTIKFERPDRHVEGLLATAELRFSGGPLDGMRLIGFSVWESRRGGVLVTMPARQYSIQGERRSFALFRAIDNPEAEERVKALIAEEYVRWDRVNPRELV